MYIFSSPPFREEKTWTEVSAEEKKPIPLPPPGFKAFALSWNTPRRAYHSARTTARLSRATNRKLSF